MIGAIVEKLKKGIIVDISKYSLDTTKELAQEAINARAVALKTDKDLGISTIPIIGFKKNQIKDNKSEPFITPDIKSIESVSEWTNIIAIDFRILNENLDDIVDYCEKNNIKIIAEISSMHDYENIVNKQYPVFQISTALSILYLKGNDFYFPDFKFTSELLNAECNNLIAEGKYQTRQDVQWAYDNGCNNICIGDAISNVYKRTLYFSNLDPDYNRRKK